VNRAPNPFRDVLVASFSRRFHYSINKLKQPDKTGHNMGGRHRKKKKKKQVQHIIDRPENQSPAEILCQEDPERNNEEVMAKSEPFHKPPDSNVAVWTLFVAVIVATIYALQLVAMRDTVTQMEKQTRLSVRPWVGLQEGLDAVKTTPLVIDKDRNASLVYSIFTKNYSNAPAANVWTMAQLVVADDLNTAYEQQGYTCGDAVIGKPDIGMVLFQGRDRPFTSYPSTTTISRKHESSIIGVWLAGCIGYRDQFNYLCRTRFLWGFVPDDQSQGEALQSKPVPPMTIAGHFVPTASGNAIDTCQVPKYNYGEGIYKDEPRNPN
jgi:hypothetical protein